MRTPDKFETLIAGKIALELEWDNGVLLIAKLRWSKGLEATGRTGAGDKIQQALNAYAQGQPTVWPNLAFAWHELPEFSRTVLMTLRREVPHGTTVTYGELAEMAGSPGAAQSVGQIMGANPWPLLVPCHRVLPASGDIGGYSAADGPAMKEYLLTLEGALKQV